MKYWYYLQRPLNLPPTLAEDKPGFDSFRNHISVLKEAHHLFPEKNLYKYNRNTQVSHIRHILKGCKMCYLPLQVAPTDNLPLLPLQQHLDQVLAGGVGIHP